MIFKDKLDLKNTQYAIKDLKDCFENALSSNLNLQRVSAPILVDPNTGLNDNLTANQHPVSFFVDNLNKNIEIVQSLAKWKRYALKKYDFNLGSGIFTDMNAVRSHDVLDELHSIYVDQWDWELIISQNDLNTDKLKDIVNQIYECIYATEQFINTKYPVFSKKLPDKLTFFDSQELDDLYPNTDFEEVVDIITKKHRAVFVIGIGKKLKSGRIFDSRSPEYDNWNLNGDLFVYSDVINKSIELTSMGIRVDKNELIKQIGEDNLEKVKNMDYYKGILTNELPQTIGGGVGQSRLAMFLLEKAHIGQVQVGVWPKTLKNELKEKGIILL